MSVSSSPTTRLCASLLLASAFGAAARAQTASTPPADASAAEPAVTLPSFEVQSSKDKGYIAADTISGGRLNTNLLTTPSDVSVLTRAFLDDLGLFNVNDALKFLPGVFVNDPYTVGVSGGDPRDFGSNVTFRGLPSGGTTRNYFNYSTTVEDYILERVDGTRGPNSILYGTSLSGGSINATTKTPQWNDFVVVTPRMDTRGSTRIAVDVNEVIAPDLAVRFNAVTSDQKTWIDRSYSTFAAADLALTWKPWKGGEFRGDFEAGHKEVSQVTSAYYDDSSTWDHTTAVTAPLTASPAASTGLSRYTGDTLIYSNAWTGAMNFLNFAKTTGTGLAITPENDRFANFPIIDRKSFSLEPPNLTSKSAYEVGQFFYDQRFDSGLLTEVAFSAEEALKHLDSQIWSALYLDPNKVLPNGQPNPEYNRPYSDTTLNAEMSKIPNYDTSIRASAAYPIKTSWMENTISAVVSRYWSDFDPVSYRPGRINGSSASITATANVLTYREYLDDVDTHWVLPTNSNGYVIDYEKGRDTTQASRLDSAQINSVGSYFGNTLTVIGGLRRDLYTGSDRDIATYDAVGHPASYSTYAYNDDLTTFAIGATYFPIPQVGAYINASDGFSPSLQQFQPLPGRPTIPATTSRVYTYGLRGRLLDGRIVGSVGYYSSREKDHLQSVSTSQIDTIWTDLNLSQNEPTVLQSYFDTYDYHAHGFEGDLTVNLTDHFRLMTNFSLPQTEQSNSLPGSKAYLAANLAQWTAGANDLTNPNHAAIASNLATYESTVTSAVDGRPLNGTFKWTSNVFGVYDFDWGWAKGLRIGAGANIYGCRLIGNQVNLPFSYIYADQYAVATALMGYSFKIYRQPVDIQVNISNLLDYSSPVFTATTVYSNQAYRGAFYYVAPRVATFTANIRF